MTIKHFYDQALAQGSYAIESDGQVALVDPWRDPAVFLAFASARQADIVAIFETHPHADFISSHLELMQLTGATVYIHEKAGVRYQHDHLGHGDEVKVGKVTLRALFTPGHSPDHNSYLLLDENGREHAVFTGDSLFVGDVGRPDLREGAGNLQVNRKELAAMMFDTIHEVYAKLADSIIVYPAHGAGSLCGKNLSDDLSSTIGREKASNWAFKIKDRQEFVAAFLEGQAFIPQYFPASVEINRIGAEPLQAAVAAVRRAEGAAILNGALIVDVREQAAFKQGHLEGAINIQDIEEEKFETWLGSIVAPSEKFHLVAASPEELDSAIRRAAKIGYEANIISGIVHPKGTMSADEPIDLERFKADPQAFTIVDIRNESEAAAHQFFGRAINLPLHELRDRAGELPQDKPIVVHCAGGYRSAAGFSIIKAFSEAQVYDLSEAVKSI